MLSYECRKIRWIALFVLMSFILYQTRADAAELDNLDIISVELPLIDENGKSPFDFVISPQKLLYHIDDEQCGNISVEEEATVYFENQDGEYDFSKNSDWLSVINRSTVPILLTVTANIENLGEINISESNDFTDRDDPGFYLALMDDKGNVWSFCEDEKIFFTIEMEAEDDEPYSFRLTGACNTNADWSGIEEHPVVMITWGVEEIGNEEIEIAEIEDEEIFIEKEENQEMKKETENHTLKDKVIDSSIEELETGEDLEVGDVIENKIEVKESEETEVEVEVKESKVTESETTDEKTEMTEVEIIESKVEESEALESKNAEMKTEVEEAIEPEVIETETNIAEKKETEIKKEESEKTEIELEKIEFPEIKLKEMGEKEMISKKEEDNNSEIEITDNFASESENTEISELNPMVKGNINELGAEVEIKSTDIKQTEMEEEKINKKKEGRDLEREDVNNGLSENLGAMEIERK